MTSYTFHANAEPNSPAIATATEADVRTKCAELSGRYGILGIPSVARKLREDGIVYIAVSRDGEYVGRGFIIRKVKG